jgi:hypothetical protein
MSKNYTNTVSFYQGMEGQLMPGEIIIWRGRPKKSAFVLNSSIKMAPFAIIWLLIDCSFIVPMLGVGSAFGIGRMLGFMIPFFAIHLMPVWIWLYNMLTACGRWKNTEYAVTDKRIILCNGLVGYEFQSIYYKDIAHVTMHVGAIDRFCGVGDISVLLNFRDAGENGASASILDVERPEEVYSIVQKTVLNVQTDIHYPNALRPEENPGYNTQYRP